MLQIYDRLDGLDQPSEQLTLPFDKRQKSRLRVSLDSNIEAFLTLKHGTLLRNGDLLRAENGLIIEVRAANEEVATASTVDSLLFARACYHLGNRHTALQIGNGWLRLQRDHVLEDMIRSLGLDVRHERAPFEPEGGAYRSHHNHSHSNEK